MSFSGIEAGKAYVKIILDDSEFKSQLNKAGKSLIKFGSIGAAATAPLIAGFTAAAYTFANAGSELNDMSQRTGVGAEALSELKYAAEQSGTSMEAVEMALRTMARKGMDPNKFHEVAASIAAITDPAKRTQAAIAAFGRSGTAVLPMLADGAEGLQAMRDKAHALGITMSSENVAAADALGDAIDTAKAQVYGLAIQVGAAIAGPLTEFLTWTQGIVAWTIDFIRNNPAMVASIAAITAAVAALSAGITILGTVMLVISAHPIIAALVAILALIIGIAAYFGVASSASGQFKSSLDKVSNIPGVSAALKSTSSPVVSPSAATTAQATAGGGSIKDVAKWTQLTAEHCARMVQLLSDSGLTVGAS